MKLLLYANVEEHNGEVAEQTSHEVKASSGAGEHKVSASKNMKNI
jgi:hypothetical protein